ncbi:MAG: ABC transporter substrate-binding protein, partial [Candidatus Bathyarchaeia archaeon]
KMETKTAVAIAVVVIIVVGAIAGYYYFVIMAPKPIMKLLLTYHAPDPDERKVAELMKSELKKLGIELEVRGMEWDAQWDLAVADPTTAQHIFVFYWWPTILSGYDFLVNMFHTEEEPFFNLGYYYDSAFDDLIDTAYELEATDPTTSLQKYTQAQEMLIEDSPAIFFYDLENTHVIREAVGGYVDNPAYPHVVLYRDLIPPTGETTFRRAEPAIIITDLDPSTQFSNEIIIIAGNMYEPLTWVNPDGEVVGVLAKSWTVSDDGLTWNFTLREGVKFHDGTLMNSTAVKLSFDRTSRMGLGAAFIWAAVNETITFDDDPYLIQFKLNFPSPLDKIAAASYASWVFSPEVFKVGNDAEIGEWLNGPPPDSGIFAGDPPYDVGTGPYYLDEWVPGSHAILKKFDDYWGNWTGGPYYDTIYLTYVEEAATRETGILGEEYDFTYETAKEGLESLDASPVADVVDIPSFQNLLGLLNTKRAPTDNKLVRQALAYATPYQTIIDEVLVGYGVQSRGPVPAGLFGHIDTLFKYTNNLDKARELLTEAGYKPKASAMTMAGLLVYIDSLIPCFYVITFLVKHEWDYSPTYRRGLPYQL